MLGKILRRENEGVRTIWGRVVTRDVVEEFNLVPIENRQNTDSPTHNIMARSSVHGQVYFAGKAYEGTTMNGQDKFDLYFEIPDTSLDGKKLMALGNGIGEFDILPQQKKKTATVEQGAAQAA